MDIKDRIYPSDFFHKLCCPQDDHTKADKMSSTDNKEKNVELGPVSTGSDADEQQITKPVSRFTRWYRSPLFNVIMVGLISFTQPGIWNALNSTGAGGAQEPYLVNGSNSLTFGYVSLLSHGPRPNYIP